VPRKRVLGEAPTLSGLMPKGGYFLTGKLEPARFLRDVHSRLKVAVPQTLGGFLRVSRGLYRRSTKARTLRIDGRSPAKRPNMHRLHSSVVM